MIKKKPSKLSLDIMSEGSSKAAIRHYSTALLVSPDFAEAHFRISFVF
jgi:hypothetical protein